MVRVVVVIVVAVLTVVWVIPSALLAALIWRSWRQPQPTDERLAEIAKLF